MTLALYSCFALPLLAAMFILYFDLRRSRRKRDGLIAKCAGTFLAVGSAFFALYAKEGCPVPRLVLLAFLVFAAADALLEISFLPGMLLFAVGHVFLLASFWQAYPPAWITLGFWAAAMLFALVLFWKRLRRMGKMLIPSCIYTGVLSCTMSMCLTVPFLYGGQFWFLGIGGLSFFASDMILARVEFAGAGDVWHKPIMITYWAALYLIAAALW